IPIKKGFAPLIDDKKITAPENYKDLLIYETPKGKTTKKIQFNTAMGEITLTGEFQLRLQDDRRFNIERYTMRLEFPGCSGDIEKAQVNFLIRLETFNSKPIDLTKAVNMSFADDTADDGQGGWTDQGAENDMANLPPGVLNLGGINFNIIDPVKNHNRSCIVVSGQPTRRYPPIFAVTFPRLEQHAYLYLLHGAAWVPKNGEEVGAVIVDYADNSRSRYPVRNGIDVGNWWRPSMSFSNAFLMYRTENAGGAVGLFVSHFRLEDKPVKTISFEPVKGVWSIAAASFANLPQTQAAEKPYIVKEGDNWSAITFDGSVLANSPLDFSWLLDAPAGKHGYIQANSQGQFIFEQQPQKIVRFWGTNLAQSALFPTHEESDKLATALAANGYNSVRLHQFERGLIDRKANDTLTFAPEQLDRFFYLIFALKSRGIYLCTDIYATRPVRPGDNIAECAKADGMERKVLNYFSPSAMVNWKAFAQKLLTTRNPYTQLTLAEDPALYMVCLDNESPITETWNQFPLVAHIPEESFRRACETKNIPIPTGEKYRLAFRRYLGERQIATQREQSEFLRKLGCRFLITNLNNDAYMELQPFRQELDLIDIHAYFDHPTYPQARWGLPVAFHQKSPIATELNELTSVSVPRIFGKPFVVTELDFCSPNRFRSVGGVLTGTYAALQDWAGIYRFTYTHSAKNFRQPGIQHGFDTIFDPVRTLADRQGALLFLRGDATSAKIAVAFGWNAQSIQRHYPADFARLGLFGRIGALPDSTQGDGVKVTAFSDWKATLPPEFSRALSQLNRDKCESSNGELLLLPQKNIARIVTPKTEAVALAKGDFGGKILQVSGVNTFSTVSLHSLDGKVLASSGDMLLFFLTDSANSNMRFSNDERTLLEDWGKLPLVIRRGKAQITLKISAVPGLQIERLKPNGESAGAIPYTSNSDGIKFELDASTAPVCRIYVRH
ncbi:MAG: hypothetical protein LBM70_01105, partial [Victivallales bacterium]|nr:hypothetical protein [Victivallales bacterium]